MTRSITTTAFVLLSLALSCGVKAGPAATTNAAVPAPADAATRSVAYWKDVRTLQESAEFKALESTVGLRNQSQAAVTTGRAEHRQAVLSVALDTPQAAADFIDRAGEATRGSKLGGAAAAALRIRASTQMVAAAAALVKPEQKDRAEYFRANLSTGIPGLPGVYLDGNETSAKAVPGAQGLEVSPSPVAGSASEFGDTRSARGAPSGQSSASGNAGYSSSGASGSYSGTGGGGGAGGGSRGIPGLPGIYLNDTPRPSIPAGFAPVSGGSLGCGH